MLFTPEMRDCVGSRSGPVFQRCGSASWIEFSDTVPHGITEKGNCAQRKRLYHGARYALGGRLPRRSGTGEGFCPGQPLRPHRFERRKYRSEQTWVRKFALTFYTRPGTILGPTAAVMSPAYGAVTADRYQPVVFQFSRAVDRAVLRQCFVQSLFKAAYTWDGGDTSCTVTPLEELKLARGLHGEGGFSLTDVFGNTVGADVTSWFSEGTVALGPQSRPW